jgi:hypothetical protein
MKKKKLFLIILLIAVAFMAYAAVLPKIFKFDKKNALNEWQEKIFKNRVLYTVEPGKGTGQLLAKSNNASSGLYYKIRFDPKRYPMISWKWKVIKFPEKTASQKNALGAREESVWDKILTALHLKPKPEPEKAQKPENGKNTREGWLEKDDYAARVYIIFPSWFFPNTKCIEYIWSEDLPAGKIITSPYFSNIKLIVVRSGKIDGDGWSFEERNIYDDYKRAFGTKPSSVGAIALMTDTDNTMSTAEALYADIKVGYQK